MLTAMFRGTLVLIVLVPATVILGFLSMLGELLSPKLGAARHLGCLWSRLILLPAGVRVECEGRERMENLGAAVIVVNHCSNFDIYALFVTLKVPFRFVAKASLFRIPIFGWAIRAAGFVPVDREHRERAVASLRRVGETLRHGYSVIFFPEGTRSRNGRLQKLKKGAFVTALRAGVPVVPVAISGSHLIQQKRSIAVRPGLLKVVVGRPVPTRGMDMSDRNRLLSLVRDNLLEVLDPSQHPTTA